MSAGNILYAQSGGVTAVINATASAVIQEARRHRINVFAARNGILGALREELYDTSILSYADIRLLAKTPGGVFGSCRVKLKSLEVDRKRYERLINVFRAHDIRYFLYNGGNDSADTVLKVSTIAYELGYPLTCIGIPKTVDNDLAVTDCCPGFGSAAKYTAISVKEAGLDISAMAETSTKVFIYETMGRHAGWLAASAGLANPSSDLPPHIILFPERIFDKAVFLKKVQECVTRYGYCVVAASEGIRNADGQFVADSGGGKDDFGHTQLGGVASQLANDVQNELKLKVHWALPDYLQRSARHIASKTDLAHALAVGKYAVRYALKAKNGSMPVIRRHSSKPYRWDIVAAKLSDIANKEKTMPDHFISDDGFHITAAARDYLTPLIQGEAWPDFDRNGLPKYLQPSLPIINRRLEPFAEE